ncbi:MAG: T9SS C-terminal target domain-containing protein, partial [Calditrichaeota bacterium]
IRFHPGKGVPVEQFFARYREFTGLSPENTFVLRRAFTDALGQRHYRYRQHYRRVPLFGVEIILHERQGQVVYANGQIVSGLNVNVVPRISEAQALRRALDHLRAEEYMWENPQAEAFLQWEQHDPTATFYPRGKLVLSAGWEPPMAENFRLAYRFDIYAAVPLGRYDVFVDAHTGEVFQVINRIQTGDVPGTGLSLYNGTVPIVVDSFAGGYRLREAGRGGGIQTYDMQNSTNYNNAIDFVDADTSFTDANARAGVSAHWGVEATYDYYWNIHGRNSYDDSAGVLLSYVHYGSDFNNAFWDGTRMSFGDGDGQAFTPLVSLDVCGHELTHGVTQFSAGLIYQAESGALNESFSDIFGTMVEYYKEGANFDWYIGEDITPNGNGIRSMSNPNEFGDPDTYFGDFWAPLDGGDNGGVHTNSGVQNFWFYLLSEGGSGINDNGDPYSVTGIGINAAADIAYRNLTVYLTPSSPYYDARLGAANAAIDLFGPNSPELDAVLDAWDAVGVYFPRFGPAVSPDARRLEFLAETNVSSDTAWLTVFNMGLQPLTITDLQIQHPDFQVDPSVSLPATLPNFQDSLTFWIRFAPTQPGDALDTLRIVSNDTLNPAFPVALHGFGFEIHPAQRGVLYAVTGEASQGAFLTLDPQTGAGTLIGQTGFEDVNGVTIQPNTGIIYATVNNSTGFTDLLRINAAAGDAYVTTRIPQFNLRAIAFDLNGDLYAARFTNGDLFLIDPVTGDMTPVGSPGIPLLSGLAVNPVDGQLWGISFLNRLYKIDKTTGQATLIGNPGFARTPDIAFDEQGNLYGLAGNINEVTQLIALDTTTGAGTVIGSTGFAGIKGLAIPPTAVVGLGDPDEEVLPQRLELLPNYPNPFNPATTIVFTLPRVSRITLHIYDITGRKVRTLVNEQMPAGRHEVVWDGTNDAGRPVASGVYFYRFTASPLEGGLRGVSQTRKMVLMR